jgi:adenine-specific DNA-methyltransferase
MVSKLNQGTRVPSSCLVYTPAAVAGAMVRMLSGRPEDRWLEPCVGKGALLQALANAGVRREQIRGIDIKPRKEGGDRLAVVTRGVEFLEWSLSTRERFDKIIANPPYLAIERLQKRLRASSCRITTLGEIGVTAGSNSWFAFLCAAINLLRENGSLCFLLPAAFEYANYARGLRGKISNHFECVSVYRSERPLFSDVQDGSVILLAQGFRSEAEPSMTGRQRIRRRIFRTASELPALQMESFAEDDAANDVLRAPTVNMSPETNFAKALFSVGIGAVTGDADYFLMNEERRQTLGLPVIAFRPVLTRAKQLTAHAITRFAWLSLRDGGERVWLFHPTDQSLRHPAVAKYLRWGKSSGCKLTNHKVAIRSPWFRVLLPKPFDGFMSGMSAKGPFIALRKMDGLTATNTLYGVNFLQGTSHEARCALALGLLTSHAHEQLSRIQRNYADGLVKYELGDLRELRLRVPQEVRGASAAYRRATEALLTGNSWETRRIADDWFQHCGK